MVQAALLSCPLKQTSEIDWVSPLKSYIRMHYDDNADKFSDECATLNRLRQDMRGAGSDSASGRDLLYRYYGQLEMLDLRFPVDENNIKISFTWFDAFTSKPTSQYSLAFEKASVIFNISAVLSCHAAVQDLSEESGFKAAYYALQLSAGMFTYINENFLHAPSMDLSRDTVKTLIYVMLAQAHEIFLQRQIKEGTRSALIARVAAGSQSAYAQAKDGLEAESAKGVFDPSWLKVVQIKALHMLAVAEYYQALVEEEGKKAGPAIARLQSADRSSKQAFTFAKSFPSTPAPSSNLGADTASTLQAATKKHMETIQERLTSLIKDNDFIYHQTVPAEATLSAVTPFSPGKAIPISEMYKNQDIQKIIGPDIFRKIMPRWVVESVSRYDEERRKFVSNEFEKARDANDTMEAWMNSLGLPQILNVFKGALEQEVETDPDFDKWCREMAEQTPFGGSLDHIQQEKTMVLDSLAKSTSQLNMEERICEKMRSKYDSEWTQQPSSRLNATLRSDIKSYQDTISEATNSDNQLTGAARQYEKDFEAMRDAGAKGETDVLYQQAIINAGGANGRSRGANEDNLIDADFGQSGPSLADKITEVETMLRSWEKLKKERKRLLEQLRTASLADDISEVVLLNKKSIPNHERELFQAELSKYDAQVGELAKAYHVQQSRRQAIDMKYKELLTDKRVTTNRERFEQVHKTKSSVMSRYRKIYIAHKDLVDGLRQAENFYTEMKESVTSLGKNVEAFLSNRRAEGAQLLNKIEQSKSSAASGTTAAENERLQTLMARLAVDSASSGADRPPPVPPQQAAPEHAANIYPAMNADPRFTIPPREVPAPVNTDGYTHPLNRVESTKTPQATSPKAADPAQQHAFSQGVASPLSQPYNPMAYPERKSPLQGGVSYSQQQIQQQPPQPRFPQSPPQQGVQLNTAIAQQPSYFPPQSHTPQPPGQSHHQPGIQSPLQSMTFTSPAAPYPPHFQYPGMQPPPPQQQHPAYISQQQYQQQQQQPQPQPHPQQQQQQQQSQPYPGYATNAYHGNPTAGLGPGPGPSPYNMPQNYIPPPPPPGPPGGGSSTQYPPHAGPWASGPGGYATYQQPRPPTAQGQRVDGHYQSPPQHPANTSSGPGVGQGQGDIWAGLSVWK